MHVQLPCATPDCNYGDGGPVYKTPALEFADAIQMLNIHRADAHGVQAVGVVVLVVVSSRHNYLKYQGLKLVVEVAKRILDSLK